MQVITERTRKPTGLASLAIYGCVALLVSACSNPNPLRRESAPEPALSPTRTAAPAPTSQTQTPTQAPTSNLELTKPTADAQSQTPVETTESRATAKPVVTRYALCSQVKPAVTQVTPQLSTTTGQIVYLTSDYNIVLTDLTGRTRIEVTNDAFVSQGAGRIYQFPTFSADGTSLAFVSVAGDQSAITQTVHVAPASNASARATLTNLFSTNDYNIPYLDWSPDSNQVAFLTISSQSGSIRVVNKSGGDVAVFDTGSPTYWDWRSDSTAMATHLGGRATTKGSANVSVIAANGALKGEQTVVEELPGSFQSPHFSPDGKYLLYVANTSEMDELVLADGAGKPICTLAPVNENAYFAWSPNGAYVAVMDTSVSSGMLIPSPLRIFDLAAGTNKQVHDGASMFFWSPGGQKLAVYSIAFDATLTPLGSSASKLNAPVSQTRSLALRIEIVDATSGKAFKVADTYPSESFLPYFPYFDQYSRAVTPWSPDGKHIVFSSASPTQGTANIAVATINEAQTSVDLKRIAAGTVAFWSPR